MPRRVVGICLARAEIATSVELIMELDDVLSRPKIASKTTQALSQKFVDAYKGVSLLVSVSSAVDVCRDPKDNHVLAAAMDAKVNPIVTGDADLLELDAYHGIRIVTPADSLPLLAG